MVVLDSSAVLALLRGEAGHERVAAVLDGARISAVNFGECVARLADANGSVAEGIADLCSLAMTVVPHDQAQAEATGALRSLTRSRGLSYGDRACLALAAALGAPALTTDRAWAGFDAGVAVQLIR